MENFVGRCITRDVHVAYMAVNSTYTKLDFIEFSNTVNHSFNLVFTSENDSLFRVLLSPSFGHVNSSNNAFGIYPKMLAIRHLHISHNAPAPKILRNIYFSFLLGITAVSREIENNAYAIFLGGGGRGGGGE